MQPIPRLQEAIDYGRSVEPKPPSFMSPRSAEQQPVPTTGAPRAGSNSREKKVKARKTEPPLKINKAKKAYAVLEMAGRIVRGAHGRTYWNGMCFPPVNPGQRRTAKMVFFPWESAQAAVGMLPPDTSADNVQDWLGWQLESVAYWLDGECRQNGALTSPAEATDVSKEGHNTLVLTHEGTSLTVMRDGVVLKSFLNVPAHWCFAVGGFGGKVQLMREHDDAGGFLPRMRVNDVCAFQVPDGDMGAGGSDPFVKFQLVTDLGVLEQLPCEWR